MTGRDRECSLSYVSILVAALYVDLRPMTYDSTAKGPMGAPFWSLYLKLGLSPWCFLTSDSNVLPKDDGSSSGIEGKR
jgi:hypothetical protein